MTTAVKICGTTTLEDARLSVAAGAAALGFIFAPSKRQVSAAQVAAITRELPPTVARVGVFTEPDVEAIATAVRAAGLTAVQMHWAYHTEHALALRSVLGEGVALWQVVGVPAGMALEPEFEETFRAHLREVMTSPVLDVVLLDSVKDGRSGGLGAAFSWEGAAAAVRDVLRNRDQEAKEKPALAVAGGLNAENVADPIRFLRPWAVDVVSGVEASPGRKSPERLEAFLGAVRAAGEGASTAAVAGNVG